MCQACVNRLFLQGPAPCPICKTTLRKSNFVIQTFEDLYVEKEVQIRRKVGRYFNKRLEDFKSLLEYNDYLEEAEEIIFNMINNVNVQETADRIEKYRLENKDIIALNMSKQKLEEKQITQLLHKEKLEKQLRHQKYLDAVKQEEYQRASSKAMIIEKLALADSKEVDKIVKESKTLNRPVFAKLEPVQVDIPMVEDLEDQELEYTPLDNPFVVSVGNYSCSWVNVLKDVKGVRGGGYSAVQTHKRAVFSMQNGLFYGIESQ